MIYVKDEEKSGCARSRGVSDECPEQIGERIKIRGKKRTTGGIRGRPRKTTQLFGGDDSDEDLDLVEGVPDVEGDEEEEGEAGATPAGGKKEEKSAREYDKFTSWFTKFAEKNGAKRRRYTELFVVPTGFLSSSKFKCRLVLKRLLYDCCRMIYFNEFRCTFHAMFYAIYILDGVYQCYRHLPLRFCLSFIQTAFLLYLLSGPKYQMGVAWRRLIKMWNF